MGGACEPLPRLRGCSSPALAALALCLLIVSGANVADAQDEEARAPPPPPPQLACAAPTTGFCTACDACCADLDAGACDACMDAECGPPPPPPDHRCVADGEAGRCNVCEECCDKPWLSVAHDCDACVEAACAPKKAKVEDTREFACANFGTAEQPQKCSKECLSSCWTSPLSSPCVSDCAHDPTALLYVILVSFLGRLSDFFWDKIVAAIQWLKDGLTTCLENIWSWCIATLTWLLCCCKANTPAAQGTGGSEYAAVTEGEDQASLGARGDPGCWPG